MPWRAVLFDLDGTLLDSLADIADAGNAALARFGLPPHPTEDYRRFIGDGIEMLVRRAVPPGFDDPALLARCVETYRDTYAAAWNVRSRLYDGIPDLLDALTARGLILSVLSNKPDVFTRRCADHYLARWPFPVVFGERAGIARKPAPAGAIEVARLLDLPPSSFLYLGDSGVDMATARGAGMMPIGVTWGFRPESELRQAGAGAIIARPIDLLNILEDSRA